MKRYHQDMARLKAKWRAKSVEIFFFHPGQPGRHRKIKPGDCGHARCWVCSYKKFSNYKNRKQKAADLTHKEQVS